MRDLVHDTERLRLLALYDARVPEDLTGPSGPDGSALDPKTLALVRLAALVSAGGTLPSYVAETDDAVDAGATAAEIVAVLVGVVPIVGLPCIVAAAPSLAMALGFDTDDAFER